VEEPAGLPGEEATSGEGGTLGNKAGSDVRVVGHQVGKLMRVERCLGDDLIPIDSFEEIDLKVMGLAAGLSVKGNFGRFRGSYSKAILKYDLGGSLDRLTLISAEG